MAEAFVIRGFDPYAATAAEFAAQVEFHRILLAEGWPDEPPPTVDEVQREMTSAVEFSERHYWVAIDETNSLVGAANLGIKHGESNQHAATFHIEVLPEYRRYRVATALLAEVVEVADSAGRALLLTFASDLVPAAAAFLKKSGAQNAQSTTKSVLELFAVNRGLMRSWREAGESLRPQFELGFWDGRYPEEELEAIARLHDAMNTSPRGDLDIQDEIWSADEIRAREDEVAKTATQRWAAYVRHRGSGQLTGYTEVHWREEHPEIIGQGDTAVVPEFRERGIGRWLKAAMLERILGERPQAERIRTWNASANEPMLRINRAMGFQPVMTSSTWQVTVERVNQYLREVS